jgi:hypothetical protein
MTRIEKAHRRCERAEALRGVAQTLNARLLDMPLGDPGRLGVSLAALALHERAAALVALAGGDGDQAREHLVEARWFARAARKREPVRLAAGERRAAMMEVGNDGD